MKTKTRWFAVLLALAMIVTFMPAAVIADDGIQPEREDDFPENEELLPDWDGYIDHFINGWIKDSDHPGGENFRHEVTDVEIVSQNPETEGKTVIAKPKRDENGNWNYRAENYGSAELKITYTDGLNSQSKTHTFTVYVKDTIYSVDIWSESGYWQGLPGSSITLRALGWKDYIEYSSENRDEWQHKGTDVGLTYAWSITEGQDYAEIIPDEDDSSKAVVTFNEMPAGWEGIGERVKVKVAISDNNSDPPAVERASREEDLWVNDEYYQISPGTIDSSLDVGESITITPELWHYKLNDTETKVNNALFSIKDVDTNALEVTRNNEQYNIKRLGEWDTGFKIEAEFDNSGGERDKTEQWYNFDRKNYDIWFEHNSEQVYTDGTLDYILKTDNLDEDWSSKYDISFKVGKAEWNEDNHRWDWKTVFNPSAEYSIVDGHIVRFNGSALGAYKDEGITIYAELKLKNTDIILSEEDAWAEVREPWEDRDFPGYYDDGSHEYRENLLRGWDLYIDDHVGYRGGRAANPHYDGEYIVNSVTKESGEAVTIKEETYKDDGDNRKKWRIEAVNNGISTIKVSFTDERGMSTLTGPYEFKVNVIDDIYEVTLDSTDGRFTVDPGESINLRAYAVHKYTTDREDEGWDYGETQEGLRCEWLLEENENGVADIRPDPNDSSKAVLKFKNGVTGGTRVRVNVFDGEGRDPVAETFDYYEASDDYDQIKPYKIDPDLGLYAHEDVDLDVVARIDGEESEIPFEKSYNWFFDDNQVRISRIVTDGDDGEVSYERINNGDPVSDTSKFRITRLDTGYIRIVLRADYGGMNRLKWHAYYFDPLGPEDHGDWTPDVHVETGSGQACEEDLANTLYVKPDSKVFFTLETEGEDNLKHGVAPVVGFREGIPGEQGDLEKAGFGVETGLYKDLKSKCSDPAVDIDENAFGILINTTGKTIGAEGTLNYYLYRYNGDDFWSDFEDGTFSWEGETVFPAELTVKVAEIIKFNNDVGDDPPLYINGNKTYDMSIPEIDGSLEFQAGAIGNQRFDPFIELNGSNGFATDEASYSIDDRSLTLSGIKICENKHYKDMMKAGDGRNLYVRAWIKQGDEIVAYGHCNCLVIDSCEPGTHKLTEHAAVAATCTEAGSSAYWSCSVCGKFLSDKNGQSEIAENSWIIPAAGHKLVHHPAASATTEKEGNIEHWQCSVCGKYFSDAAGKTEIRAADTVISKMPAPADVNAPVAEGSTQTVAAGTVTVTSASSKTVSFTKAANKASVTVPDTVSIGGEVYTVTVIESNAFKGSKATSVTIGKNIKTVKKNAFKSSKVKTLTIKSKKLTKKSVKNSLKGSKVKTIKVKVGSKKLNKQYVKKYKKFFTKANAGAKVNVK